MLIIGGFKGSGKSYFGKLLAEALQWSFQETDKLIEESVKMTCRSYWLEYGEEAFRAKEREVVSSLMHHENQVLALGGGTLLSDENVTHLSQLGQMIYLEASEETLRHRWDRPLAFDDCYRKHRAVVDSLKLDRVWVERQNEEVIWELIHLATSLKS